MKRRPSVLTNVLHRPVEPAAKSGRSVNPIQGHLPDKTFIGRIGKGFDFLGYYFSREPLRVAEKTREKHVLHIIRLYEQLRKKKATPEEVASTLGLYVKRWQCWTQAGLCSTPVPWLARQSHYADNHKVVE